MIVIVSFSVGAAGSNVNVTFKLPSAALTVSSSVLGVSSIVAETMYVAASKG